MALLDLIDRLINEHATAAILRERLLLVKEQVIALEAKYAVTEGERDRLKEENIRLKKDCEELREKVQALSNRKIQQVQILRS